MENLDLESVCYIIVKAREFDVKVEVVEPDHGSNPSDEAMDTVLEDYGDDPVFQELKSYIDSHNVDQQCELVALAWIGRGSFDASEWAEAVREARDEHNARTAEYLLGMPLLSDYLEEGLSALGRSCEEVDKQHL